MIGFEYNLIVKSTKVMIPTVKPKIVTHNMISIQLIFDIDTKSSIIIII